MSHRDHDGFDASAEGLCAYCLKDSVDYLRAEVEALKGQESRYIAELIEAGKALKFCAQWGGRSGRIPGNGPGTKPFRAKEAFKRLKLFLFNAALSTPAPAPAEKP